MLARRSQCRVIAGRRQMGLGVYSRFTSLTNLRAGPLLHLLPDKSKRITSVHEIGCDLFTVCSAI